MEPTEPTIEEPIEPEPKRTDFVRSYAVTDRGLVIDGEPCPWFVHIDGPMVAPWSDDRAENVVHVLWVPLIADGPMPTPPVGVPDGPRSLGYDAVHALTEALRLTVEYVGTDTLPPVEGWSWYDALRQYAPEVAEQFTARQAENPEQPLPPVGTRLPWASGAPVPPGWEVAEPAPEPDAPKVIVRVAEAETGPGDLPPFVGSGLTGPPYGRIVHEQPQRCERCGAGPGEDHDAAKHPEVTG